jgi:hypothetical protein
VIGKDRMTFEGQKTTWETLPQLLEKVPNRSITVLELAVSSPEIAYVPGTREENENFKLINWRMFKLQAEYGFEYLSHVGIHPLGSKGDTTRSLLPYGE